MPQNNYHNQNDKQPELRLFLSSTFNDLQPEREQLVKKVFPRIRAVARERGVEFTEIDLRWGITAEESRSGKVVRICLEEIDKCRPYFLGILGSRYGWRPQLSDIEKDQELLNVYPWLKKFAEDDKSIVELEFMYGALQNEDEGTALFYEQNCDEIISEEDRIPYGKLKNTLRASGLLYNSFNTPEELGEHVLRDLVAILERDFPVKKEQTPAERERNAHEAFAHNRTHSYIANQEYYERFEKFIESTDSPLILWGKSGFGKSALMAHLTNESRHHYPEAFIIRHFTGATTGASSADEVMRHIFLEIKERYDLTDAILTENLQNEFSSWLAKIPAKEKLILAIDAVNQLTGIGPEMHWLPEFIPQNVRLIISTTPEISLDELRKRNWQEIEIKPLSGEQRKRITHEFLEHYHKHLSPDQLEVIATAVKLESPLFLRTLLEELRIFGSFTAIDVHIANYLSSENEAELFQKVLSRMESDHGEETVRQVMTVIWASRFGLSETELLGITGFPRLVLSEFLGTLEFHLMQRSRLFTFFHNYLREAVLLRYLTKRDDLVAAHKKIAAYFSSGEYTERRRDEEPWQWQQSEAWDQFMTCMTSASMLEMLLDESRQQELIGYWVELQKHADLAETYREASERFRKEITDDADFATLSGKLGNALVAASSYKEAEYDIRIALEIREKLFGENDLKTAESMNDLATLFYHTGNFTDAEELLQEVVSIRESILGKNDPVTVNSMSTLATIFYSKGDLEKAEEYFTIALERYQSYYKHDRYEIAEILNNIGSVLFQRNKYVDAIQYLDEGLDMLERLYGKAHISLIHPIQNLATCYTRIEENNKAERLYQKALILNKSIYGEVHFSTSHIYANMGTFYSRTGDPKKAIEMHTKGLEIKKKILGEDHWETINSYINIGLALYRAGEVNEGEKFVNEYLPLQEKLLGANHQLYLLNKTSWDELQHMK